MAAVLCIVVGSAALLAETSYEYNTYYLDSSDMTLTYYPDNGDFPIGEITVLTGTQITEHVPLHWQEQQNGSLVAEIDAPGATRLYIPESDFATDLYVSFNRTQWYVEGRYFVKVQSITVTPTRRPTNTPTPAPSMTPTAEPVYYDYLPYIVR